MNKTLFYKREAHLYLALFTLVSALFGLYWFLTHAYLTIKVNPKDATVVIDNALVKVGPTGKVKKILSPGKYSIRIEAEGYVGWIQEVNLRRSQRRTIAAALKETPQAVPVAQGATHLSKGPDFNTIYYLGDNGKTIYRAKTNVDSNGEVQVRENIAITESKLSGIQDIIWSPNHELALFKKKDGVTLFDFKKYDFLNQTETVWGKDIGAVAWAPDNSKVAYVLANSTERSLIFANIANSEPIRVANLADYKIENPVLRWSPDSEWLLVIPQNSNSEDDKIYAFNAYSRTLKELAETGNQIGAAYSPDNNKVLYATYSKNGSNPVTSVLSIMDANGDNKRFLNLRTELNKTHWLKDSKTILVAIAKPGATAETIYGFNIETKQRTSFSLTPTEIGSIKKLMASDDERIILVESNKGIFAIKAE